MGTGIPSGVMEVSIGSKELPLPSGLDYRGYWIGRKWPITAGPDGIRESIAGILLRK